MEPFHVSGRESDEVRDARVQALARELASAINEATPAGRTGMRDLAIELLKEEVEARPAPAPGEGPTGDGASVNPFALGLPMFLVGGFLSFLFPPVGLGLVVFSLVICAVGLVTAMGRSFGRRRRDPLEDE